MLLAKSNANTVPLPPDHTHAPGGALHGLIVSLCVHLSVCLQVSDKERQAQQDNLFKDVAGVLVEKTVSWGCQVLGGLLAHIMEACGLKTPFWHLPG